MKQIPLTRGAWAIVDDDEYDFLSQFNWHLTSHGYAARNLTVSKGRQAKILMHRVVVGSPPGKTVDHINGDRLDNRKENLRCGFPHEQAHARSRPFIAFKGVYAGSNGRYYARVKYRGTVYPCGGYATQEEAARAYDRKAIELLGERARTNFPQET